MPLAQVYGERKFGESLRSLVISTYDAVGGRLFLLKTAHHNHLRYDYDAPEVEVALATAAAPTYFAAARFPNHGNNSYVDGGVWANSPTLAALVEAVHFLGQRPEDIDILSIGTTSVPFNVARNTGRASSAGTKARAASSRRTTPGARPVLARRCPQFTA